MPHLLTKPCQKQHHLTAGTQNPTGMFKGILGLKRGPFITCICWGYCSYHLLAIIHESFFKERLQCPAFQVKEVYGRKYHILLTGQMDLEDDSGLIAQQTERKHSCYFKTATVCLSPGCEMLHSMGV